MTTTAQLTCPACRELGRGAVRIGNHRQSCRVCNRFAQAVLRQTAKAMRETYPQEYAAVRARIETEVYRATVTGAQ